MTYDAQHLEDLAKHFEKENAKTMKVVYGGDGAVVDAWRSLSKSRQGLLPVRNYGLCQKHLDFYTKFFAANDDEDENLSLKQFLFPTLRGTFSASIAGKNECTALSEITVICADPTSALRFNIYMNKKLVMQNVIANGAIFAAKLGSTGYFKSIARTIFTDGIGIGLICPTYSVPNIVAASHDFIKLELVRSSKVLVTADKQCIEGYADAGWSTDVADACDNVAIFGYDYFMCPECRKNRNSSLVNDNYIIA